MHASSYEEFCVDARIMRFHEVQVPDEGRKELVAG